jgi:hypothetical protein
LFKHCTSVDLASMLLDGQVHKQHWFSLLDMQKSHVSISSL